MLKVSVKLKGLNVGIISTIFVAALSFFTIESMFQRFVAEQTPV